MKLIYRIDLLYKDTYLNKENKLVKNRPSPRNEKSYIKAYQELNKKAANPDGKDIAAVTTKAGVRGHALLTPQANRSKDNKYHRGEDFISDAEIKKRMK